MKILIIDDNDQIGMMLGYWCRSSGRTALIESGGRAGLRTWAERGADVVLVDVDMPGMKGTEVCEAIRSSPGGDAIPVVLMSGRTQVEVARLAADCGATAFVTKPFDLAELDRLIRRVVPAGMRAGS